MHAAAELAGVGSGLRAHGSATEGPAVIVLEVLGTPAPKGSMRAVIRKSDGRAVLVPSGSRKNARELYAWTKAIRAHVAEQLGTIGEPLFVDQAIAVHLLFRLARPRSHYGARGLLPSAPRHHTVKPDVDKLMRSTLDALTGELIDDDARIRVIQADKQWCDAGRQGVVITVESLSKQRSLPSSGRAIVEEG